MRRASGPAVAAGLPGAGRTAMDAALAEAGIGPVFHAADAREALRLLQAHEADLVLADAVLPGMDGAALAGEIRGLRLNVQPAVVLLRVPGCMLPGADRLAALGAAVLEKPLDGAALTGALEALAACPPPLPDDRAARLEALLDALGVPEHPGRDCLREAVALVWRDRRLLRPLRAGLYPEVSRRTGLTTAQVERAARYAIDAAWRAGDLAQQHKLFGHTIDARRGKPTCGEMIAQLADILRWEG